MLAALDSHLSQDTVGTNIVQRQGIDLQSLVSTDAPLAWL